MKRRSFLKGLIAAPVVITTPGLLMPVRSLPKEYVWIGFDYAQDSTYKTWELNIHNTDIIRQSFLVPSDLLPENNRFVSLDLLHDNPVGQAPWKDS